MLPDPFQLFRRAAAPVLARMEAQLVERALGTPASLADRAVRNARDVVVSDA